MAEPLSIDQARAQCRVDGDDEDDLIAALIVAAREHVEDSTGLVLTPRVVTETARQLGRWIDLASWPITSVDAVRYAAGGVMTLLDVDAYALSLTRRPVRILPRYWGWGIGVGAVAPYGCAPPALPAEIDVMAGFATPDDVPATVKQAMLLLIQHWFDNRSATEVGTRAAAIEVPFAVEALLRRWRLPTI